ncbi:unnamed protein product [Lactuca saligna]|uniref:Uncharacterized protein n=1 Tax=Lactuca saligna TaxID=75948 RepID=A0AA35YR79_LACSI|nr:unnamed protein product [Lactuca saligna]
MLYMSIRSLPGDHGLPLQQPDVSLGLVDVVNKGGELFANLTAPCEAVAKEVAAKLSSAWKCIEIDGKTHANITKCCKIQVIPKQGTRQILDTSGSQISLLNITTILQSYCCIWSCPSPLYVGTSIGITCKQLSPFIQIYQVDLSVDFFVLAKSQNQHMMPPYAAFYPHGGVYAHPIVHLVSLHDLSKIILFVDQLSSWQIPTDVTEQRKKKERYGVEDGISSIEIMFYNSLPTILGVSYNSYWRILKQHVSLLHYFYFITLYGGDDALDQATKEGGDRDTLTVMAPIAKKEKRNKAYDVDMISETRRCPLIAM